MPRHSLIDQRRPEILEAFARCIGRLGIAGTSLEAVATEAGMRRSILRHFVGNRDDLLIETARYVAKEVERNLPELVDRLRSDSASKMVANLFELGDESGDWIRIFDVFVAEGGRDPRVAAIIEPAFDNSIRAWADCLGHMYPGASADRSRAVASGLMALRTQAVCRRHLGRIEGSTVAERVGAELLLGSLGRRKSSPRRSPPGKSPALPELEPEVENEAIGEDTVIGVND